MPASNKPDELFIRLYFDRHIKPQLATDLRADGYDVMTTQEASMDTAPTRTNSNSRAGKDAPSLPSTFETSRPSTSNG